MMTLEAWCKRHSVARITGKKWFEKGWIPGSDKDADGNYLVPDHAREPYSAARAKKDRSSVLLSICTACNSGKGVSPSLYQMSPESFSSIVEELIKEDLIHPVEIDGVTYYNPTTKTIDYILKYNKNTTKEKLEAAKAAAELAGVFIGAICSAVAKNDS